jgi:hypothetical protein
MSAGTGFYVASSRTTQHGALYIDPEPPCVTYSDGRDTWEGYQHEANE